jgi:hypothetical protein
MFARIASASLRRWGRSSLVLVLAAPLVYTSCTSSEDTEPFVPAQEGAKQPGGSGDTLTEDEACGRLRSAEEAAQARLDCDAPKAAACPTYLRPGGGNGCYRYFEDSVASCEQAYEDASSCRELTPCLVTAEFDAGLATCELPMEGAGGGDGSGGTPAGGAPAMNEGGMPGAGEGGTPAAEGGMSGGGMSGGGVGGAG